MNITLCTLFEGNYHFGVAALSNSLIAAGYEGELWVGYRGALPGWIVDSPDFDPASGRLPAGSRLTLCMVALDTPLHFTYYKPIFVRDVLERHAPDAGYVAYIDPDIVMKCDWPTFTGWFTDDGISVIEDVNGALPARHPKRLQWKRYFDQHGIPSRRGLDRYYNAGFIALARRQIGFLDLWRQVCDLVIAYNAGSKDLKVGGPEALFYSTDQDALNFTLTACETPMNTAGPEAMDFAPGGYYLSHAVGQFKPWQAGHIRHAIRGKPPTPASKSYFRFANAPIRVYSDSEFAKRQLFLRIASAIGRIYRRN